MTPTSIASALADPSAYLPPLPDDIPDLPPLTGEVELDPVAAGLLGETAVDLDDRTARHRLTQVLLVAGCPTTVQAYLSRSQFRQDWPHLDLPGPVRRRWEQAFPWLTEPR